MSNVISLTVEQLLRNSIPLQRPAMPPVALYCTPLYLPSPVVGGTVNIPVVSSIQSVQVNPTSYESSTDVLSLGQVTLTHLSCQFGLIHSDQDQGLDLRLLLASHLTEIEKAIQAYINAVIIEANYSAAVVTATSSAYALANLETLRAAVPSATIVALAPDYYVKTKDTWMPAGEGTLKEFSNLTGIGTNIKGFAARPEAVALIVGFPNPGPRSEFVETAQINLPIGVPVSFSRWFQRGGRSWRASLDICLGVEVGQPAAMRLLKSA